MRDFYAVFQHYRKKCRMGVYRSIVKTIWTYC